MPNATVRADATGLPEETAVLAETERARSSRRGFLRSGGLATLFGFTAAASASSASSAAAQEAGVSTELRELIERHRAAAVAHLEAKERHAQTQVKFKEALPSRVPFSGWYEDLERRGVQEPQPLDHPGLQNCLDRARIEFKLGFCANAAIAELPAARQKQISTALKGGRKDAERIIRGAFDQAKEARRASGVDEAAAELEHAEGAEREALAALCGFRCATVNDVNLRAEYLAAIDRARLPIADVAAALAGPHVAEEARA